MDLGLAGKRAAVAASSAGLGLGVARALAAEGARVALCGRDPQRLEWAMDRLVEEGAAADDVIALVADVSTPEAAAQKLRAALVHQDQSAPPWYLHAVQEWRMGIKDLAPRIDRTLSASQRRYALDKLQRLIIQVRDLSR